MSKYIVLVNQSRENGADDELSAFALADKLAATNPGIAFDVYQLAIQVVAPEPLKPSTVEVTRKDDKGVETKSVVTL